MQAQEQQILHLNDQVQIRDQQIQQLQQAVLQTQQQSQAAVSQAQSKADAAVASVYRSSADSQCS